MDEDSHQYLNYSRISSYLQEKSGLGTQSAVDDMLGLLNNETDLPTTKLIDYYLGRIGSAEGIARIEHYLFHGSPIQRNYCTLFFARRNDWNTVNRAYNEGLIDYKQAYSR